jgi:serine/threonine-protein kinase
VKDTVLAEGTADPYVGKMLSGRYRVVAPIGSGGMGVVYRAEHVHMRKPVAVKILRRDMTMVPDVVTRFEREAVAAGRIDHENVAAATDFGKLDDGSFYLILEFVEGRSLGTLIDAGALPTVRALVILRQIADGLAAAHAAGIVHRDLKPDNVMLVDRDGFPDFVKVLDFGIAKVPLEGGSQPLTQIGTVFGTPQYMSPEQGQGHTVDARTDLYSLGVIAYEMLAGKLPFDADDLVVLIARHITEAPAPLSPAIPEPVRALVAELLEKLPERRIQTAVQLVQRLDRLLAEPSIAPPGSIPPSAFPPRRTATTRSPPPSRERLQAMLRALDAHRARWTGDFVRMSAAWGERLPLLHRRLQVGARSVSLGRMVAGGILLACVGALFAVLLFGKSADRPDDLGAEPSGAASSAEAKAARLRALLIRAEAGDKAALAEVDALPAAEKTSDVRRAYAHGLCVTGELAACVAEYKAGLLAFPALARDRTLLADVRRAAEHATAHEDAMRLAAHQLGGPGLDVLWDVWSATKGKKESEAVTRRARQFLDDSAVRAHASRELTLVFDLERAEKRKRCADVKALLPKAIEYGDARLTPLFERLAPSRGCGFMSLGDCWSCVRGTKALESARSAAKARKAPDAAADPG